MIIAVAGNRAADGIAIAEINLKLIWDVITAIKIGNTGRVFVVMPTRTSVGCCAVMSAQPSSIDSSPPLPSGMDRRLSRLAMKANCSRSLSTRGQGRLDGDCATAHF